MEQLKESIFPDIKLVYAGFWTRFGASFIDGIIIIIINAIVTYLIFKGSLAATFVNLIFSWLYFALQESGTPQATLGKRAMQIKVTNMNGGRISFGQATGRHFAKIISAVCLLIGYISMIWDARKQTWHDKMANTLVIDAVQSVI